MISAALAAVIEGAGKAISPPRCNASTGLFAAERPDQEDTINCPATCCRLNFDTMPRARSVSSAVGSPPLGGAFVGEDDTTGDEADVSGAGD